MRKIRTIILTLVKWPIQIRLAGAIVIVIGVVGLLVVPSTPTVNAAPEPDKPLECLRCHTRVLESHDKLGSGSEACWACHDSTNMEMLRLLDETRLSLANSPQLCGQCHQKRYAAWQEGTHGVLAWKEGEPGIPGAEKPKCIDCHNPHQPQMEPSRIIKLYPPPVSEEEGALDCLRCHVRVLKAHDKLGSGSEACWACHYNMEMGMLHLAGGETKFPLSEFPRLCAQCHQKRYDAWNEGTHGVPAWKEGEPEIRGSGKVRCIGCHDPHQPQIALLNITKLHPPSAPPPPPPPTEPLIMLGISLLLITIALGVAVAKREEGP